MPTIEHSETFTASPDRLWALVIDFPQWPSWLTLMREWTAEPPSALEPGTKLEGLISIMKIPMSVSWTVDSVDAPQAIQISGVAVLNSKVTLGATITPVATPEAPNGSLVDMTIDIVNPMLMGALADSLLGAVRRDVEQSFANVRALLAAEA